MLVGLCGNIVAACLFGFAPSYLWALLFRFIGGLFNSSLPVAKAYALEVLEGNDRMKTFKLMGIAWSLGTMVGSEIGGFLSRPARHIPFLFSEGGLLSVFPYSLPLLIAALASAFGAVAVFYHFDSQRQARRVKFKDESGSDTEYTVALAISAGAFISFQDLFPQWARSATSNGGLAWSDPSTISQVQSIGSVAAIVVQYILLSRRYTEFKLVRLVMMALFPVLLVFPSARGMPPLLKGGVLIAGYCYFSITQVLVLNRLYLALAQEPYSTISSLAQYLTAISRTLCPFLFSATLAWSFTQPFPFDYHLPFYILAVMGVVCAVFVKQPRSRSYSEEDYEMNLLLLDKL